MIMVRNIEPYIYTYYIFTYFFILSLKNKIDKGTQTKKSIQFFHYIFYSISLHIYTTTTTTTKYLILFYSSVKSREGVVRGT